MNDTQRLSAIVIGICLIIGGFFFTFQSVSLFKNYERAFGKVIAEKSVKIEDDRSRRSSNKYNNYRNYPVVVFNAKDGKEYKFTSKVQSGMFTPGVNDRTAVLYNPATPQDAEISSFFTLWALPLSLFFAAFLTFLPVLFERQFNALKDSVTASIFKVLKSN